MKLGQIAAMLATAVCVQVQGAELQVEVKGVEEASGMVQVALFNSEGTWLNKRFTSMSASARKGTVSVTFKDIPMGDYAISVYHDVNGNGKLDSNFIGMPSEPYGFSNDAKGMFGPAKFEDAKFKVEGKETAIRINLN
ncbi:DUF2141 domain-containing protein [Burkholderiaceae bacterium DAT-1]|nr:DUF2141 domain-containing protein [Burkholderiaceae bacterium DAT-1]